MIHFPEYLCVFFLLWHTLCQIIGAIPVRFYLWIHRCSYQEFTCSDWEPDEADLRLGFGAYDLADRVGPCLARKYRTLMRSADRATLGALVCAISSLLLHSSVSVQLSFLGQTVKVGW